MDSSKTNKSYIGKQAEDFSLAFLKSKGLTLIARNWSCRFGEIDLIMQEMDTIIFVEVRWRSHSIYATSSESVTTSKQRKIIKASAYFLTGYQGNSFSEHYCRFDVLACSPLTKSFNSLQNNEIKVDWIKSAFDSIY